MMMKIAIADETTPLNLSKEDEDQLKSLMKGSMLFHPWEPREGEACIYRVPDRLRKLNPEAYTPQMVLIGPLHHAKRLEARQMASEMGGQSFISDERMRSRCKLYMDMEMQKDFYLTRFVEKVGLEMLSNLKNYIEREEENIRRCYAESTAWIDREDFVNTILLDAVFIVETFRRVYEKKYIKYTIHGNDVILNQPWLINTICEDLLLLENQVPYYILEHLDDSYNSVVESIVSFRGLTFNFFEINTFLESASFKHLTDLARLARTKTLDINGTEEPLAGSITNLDSAKKLQDLSIEFVPLRSQSASSINVKFAKGQLVISPLEVYDSTEMTLANVIALEQCHYPSSTYVSSYLTLLNFLMKTNEDMDLLVKESIVVDKIRHRASLMDMVNRLCRDVTDCSPYYCRIVEEINKTHDTRWYNSKATLRRLYFSNLWTGLATVGGLIILVLTVIQTAVSIHELRQNIT